MKSHRKRAKTWKFQNIDDSVIKYVKAAFIWQHNLRKDLRVFTKYWSQGFLGKCWMAEQVLAWNSANN